MPPPDPIKPPSISFDIGQPIAIMIFVQGVSKVARDLDAGRVSKPRASALLEKLVSDFLDTMDERSAGNNPT
jgi:hypothetical protein